MIAFKSCPRCQGDLLVGAAKEEVACLQCGYELKAEERDVLVARIEARRKTLAAVAA
jgi:hypothetical protein